MQRPFLALAVLAIPLVAIAGSGNFMDRSTHKPSGVSGAEAEAMLSRIDPEAKAVAIASLGVYRNGKGKSCGISSVAMPLTGRENTKQEYLHPGLLTTGPAPVANPSDRIDAVKAACNGELIWEGGQRDGDGWFVRGVTVCTDAVDTGDRTIQGMRVWYSKLKADGTLVKSEDPETWVGPKCANWEERAMCPKGWLAVGIQGHKSNSSFRALGLKCAEVKNRQE